MVMPVWDHSPFRWPTPPYVMWLLIVVNFAIFFVLADAGTEQMRHAARVAGLIPAAFTHGASPGALPAPLTLITCLFLHKNFMHVFGNMLFLFVFGDDIEEVLGHWRFLVFYLACGVGAGAAFVFSAWSSNVGAIGASGAVAGVVSAYVLFRPCAKVTVLLGLIPLRMRAYWIIGGWAIWQFYEVASGVHDGIAYWAHVGGLITGAAAFAMMRPAGVRLFDCEHSEPVLVAAESEPKTEHT
jgi:membrane associated rhomboid family serine protease